MYEYLKGRVASSSPARLVLEVGGVGYDLVVPTGSSLEPDREATVWTHLAVREDAHTLYGFRDRETRDLFRLLLKVKGVGPSMAISLLSGLRPAELVDAIVAGDAGALTRVKGVGKKTAEQILLDLGDRVRGGGFSAPAGPGTPAPAGGNLADARAALVSIGFSEREADKAVVAAAKRVGDDDVELLIRTALAP